MMSRSRGILPPPVPPFVPRVGRGQVLLQAISSAPPPLLCIAQCVSCTDAQLPSLFPHRFYCTALKASLPTAPPVCAAHCSFHAGGCRADICEGGGGFGSGAASLGFGSHTGGFAPAYQPIRITMPSLCCISLGTQLAFHNAAQLVCAPTQV